MSAALGATQAAEEPPDPLPVEPPLLLEEPPLPVEPPLLLEEPPLPVEPPLLLEEPPLLEEEPPDPETELPFDEQPALKATATRLARPKPSNVLFMKMTLPLKPGTAGTLQQHPEDAHLIS